MGRCSICYTRIQPSEATASCAECHQEYHRTCWQELGGCATYGCKAAAPAQKPPPPVLVGAGWGDTKDCPSCRAVIGSSLLVCRCGARFPWADPMTPAEYMTHLTREQGIRTAKRVLVGLFILSLAGFPAPLAGPIAAWYAWAKRADLGGANGTYLAVGYGAGALGALNTLLIVLLAAGA